MEILTSDPLETFLNAILQICDFLELNEQRYLHESVKVGHVVHRSKCGKRTN